MGTSQKNSKELSGQSYGVVSGSLLIELWSNKVIKQKIDYVHQNPVEAGLVYKAEEYVYSSARDYTDEKGLLDDAEVFRSFEF